MSKKFNVTTPSGFPEFTPAQEQVRQHWIRTISDIFEKYGFAPISTPIIERTDNLLGKGGNPKEMYVLDRLLSEGTADKDETKSRALRFDQTVPLALYVARHFNDLTFPFKRSVIGPVFRGERAQKGRFRQFDQCDIDVIGNGTLSILNDAQIPAIIIDIFKMLMPQNDFVVRINNRKVLLGFFEGIGIEADKIKKVLDIVDDLEKLSRDKILDCFASEGIGENQVEQILDFVNLSGDNFEILEKLREKPPSPLKGELAPHPPKEGADWEVFNEGVEELIQVITALNNMGVDGKCFKIDLRIARGLDYYTGTVFETNLIGYEGLGSICSGGRYDDLASLFANKKMPGVGISIGLTRLLSQLFEGGIIKTPSKTRTQILMIAADEVALGKTLEIGQQLREAGFFVENYLEKKKLGKQFDYADKMGIGYCVVIGENELSNKVVQIKSMETGDRVDVGFDEVVQKMGELVN